MQSLEPRVSGEFLVRRKRRRIIEATDPGLTFYVPSSPTSVDVNPSSETAEPRSASSENHEIPHDPSQCHSPMEVDDQPLPETPRRSSGSPTPTAMLIVERFLRESAEGSPKRRKRKHVNFDDTPDDTSPAEERSPPTITQPLTSTAPRRKRRTRSRPSRVKTIPVKGKAYRTRSQKPKAVTDDLVRAALSSHVDVDEDFLEDGREPQNLLDLENTNGLTQITPTTVRRRILVHPSKTQPFPYEPSLGNNPDACMDLGQHPRKPMSAWKGALALSKLDIRAPASTVTPRRKGRPILGPSSSRVRGKYPKLPLAPLSPTPMSTSRGCLVPGSRLRLQRGKRGQQSHPEVAAMHIISAEEITSPNSEPGSEHGFGLSILKPANQTTNRDRPAPSHKEKARASVAVTDLSHSGAQADMDNRQVRSSSPLAHDPERDMPGDHLVILVPNSSDPNLASRVSPDPSNRVSRPSSLPPPFPPPRLLSAQSHPHSLERALGYPVSTVDSDVERKAQEADAFISPITVSTQPKTADDKGDVVSGGLKVNDGKNLERWEADNVDQIRVDASLGSQGPAETPRGNVRDCIEPQGVCPRRTTSAWESDARHGEGVRKSPATNQHSNVLESVEDSKRMASPKSLLDLRTNNARGIESEARSKLQAEVEGDEDNEAIDTPKAAVDSNGPARPTLFPPLGKMLSLLDEVGPPHSVGVFGGAVTRRPRRPMGRSRSSKLIQTQPSAEVENEWQSEGTSNVNGRTGARASKSDDLSFFAGL